MKHRLRRLPAAAAAIVMGVCGTAHAASSMLGEVELKAASRAERSAGVWVDGQYVGHLQELDRKGRLVLVPGRHDLLVKLAGYMNVEQPIVVEPGQRRAYHISMPPDPAAVYPDKAQTAKLRISVEPDNAAVFVNGIYAGYVDRFNGRRGVRMRAGVYDVKIALPGYLPFETRLTLLANQDYEIKTQLSRGSIAQQPDALTATQARK